MFRRLERQILFLGYSLVRRFPQALAQIGPRRWLRSPGQLWAAYRLDLFALVADAPWNGRHPKAGIAKVVALAAIGRREDALQLADRLTGQISGSTRLIKLLAQGLAPYAPAYARDLLAKHDGAPSELLAALYLKTGRHEQALQVLGKRARKRVNPLLFSDVSRARPKESLAFLNTFMQDKGLPNLQLVDAERPPGPDNLMLVESPKAFHGPLVSVIMTAYQSSATIGTAIRSILAQSYQDLELIVVDDASNDGTESQIRELMERDSRIRYVRLACNVGTYAAKNIGLTFAKGEFVTCHDSDDWAHPLRLEYQVKPLLKDGRIVFTTSEWLRMCSDGSYYSRTIHPLMQPNPASPLFRRQVVLELAGGWDMVRIGADSEFKHRLLSVFGQQACVRIWKPLAIGSHRATSLMNSSETGYDENGVSLVRVAYNEGWRLWHIRELRDGRAPRIPFDMTAAATSRPFQAPEVIVVATQDLARCLYAVREAVHAKD